MKDTPTVASALVSLPENLAARTGRVWMRLVILASAFLAGAGMAATCGVALDHTPVDATESWIEMPGGALSVRHTASVGLVILGGVAGPCDRRTESYL